MMIDDATRDGIFATCNMSDVGPLLAQRVRAEADWEVAAGVRAAARPLGFTPLRDPATGAAVVRAGLTCDDWTNAGFNLLSGIDIYDSFSDICTAASARAGVDAARGPYGAGSNSAAGCAIGYDPCRDDKTSTYLNTAAVKTAIHALANITWTGCSSIVDYSRFDLLTSMIPVYRDLIVAGMQILVYSGDVDAIVPSLGSRAWITSMNMSTVAPIRAWTDESGQVGGWSTQYAGLNFTTIRNSGHFVPELQGARALQMFRAFLANAAV